MTTAFFFLTWKKKSHRYKTEMGLFFQKLFHFIQRIPKMGKQSNELQIFHQCAEEHSKASALSFPSQFCKTKTSKKTSAC